MTMTGLFDRVKKTRPASLKRIVFFVFAVAFTAFQVCSLAGVRINGSPSLPLGLYVTSGDPKANLIEFCPAEPFASFAISRGYRDRGSCPDGAMPLLKPVIARAGDILALSEAGISVNDRLLRKTAPLRTDTHGRPLTPWPFGRYRVAPDTLWVASSHNPRSFDSRYFGPVPIHRVRNYLRPLLTAW